MAPVIADALNLLAPAALLAFAARGEDVLALWPRFEARLWLVPAGPWS